MYESPFRDFINGSYFNSGMLSEVSIEISAAVIILIAYSKSI